MAEKKTNLHAGHRAKMKKRFREAGFAQFEDHNILEFLLFYAIPRRDTNEIAHRLIDRFGSLNGVLEASVEKLCEVDGVGEHAALLLHSYLAVARRYGDASARALKPLPSHKEMGQILVDHFAGLDHEQVYAIFYDLAFQRCGECVLHDGDVNSAGFSVRKLGEALLKYKATFLVLAHNHPNGLPIASPEDLHTTDEISVFASQMGAVLMDHFIIAGGRYAGVMKDSYEDLYRESKRRC